MCSMPLVFLVQLPGNVVPPGRLQHLTGAITAPRHLEAHGHASALSSPDFTISFLFSLKLELTVLWWEIKVWVGAPRWDGNCCGYGRLTSEPRLCGGGVAGTKMLQEHI